MQLECPQTGPLSACREQGEDRRPLTGRAPGPTKAVHPQPPLPPQQAKLFRPTCSPRPAQALPGRIMPSLPPARGNIQLAQNHLLPEASKSALRPPLYGPLWPLFSLSSDKKWSFLVSPRALKLLFDARVMGETGPTAVLTQHSLHRLLSLHPKQFSSQQVLSRAFWMWP